MNNTSKRPEPETYVDQSPINQLSEELTDTQRRLKAAIVQPLEARIEQIEKRVVEAIRSDRKSFFQSVKNALKFFISDIDR
jgi:hypothetical protein